MVPEEDFPMPGAYDITISDRAPKDITVCAQPNNSLHDPDNCFCLIDGKALENGGEILLPQALSLSTGFDGVL